MPYDSELHQKRMADSFFKNHSTFVISSKIYGLAYYEHRFSFSLSKIRKDINSFTLAMDQYIAIQSEPSKGECKAGKHDNSSCVYTHVKNRGTCLYWFLSVFYLCTIISQISNLYYSTEQKNSGSLCECFHFRPVKRCSDLLRLNNKGLFLEKSHQN